jgi:hypothetical protein
MSIVAAGNTGTIAQSIRPDSPAKAVSRCLNVVRNTKPPEHFMEPFFQNFDASYNPNTNMVYDNAQSVGDMKAQLCSGSA